jgi:hypothetical protein
MNITQKDMDRFWSKVDKERSNTFYNGERCWEWTAVRLKFGYGKINIIGKTVSTHRFSWIINNGEIPDKLNVLHHCDNPCCIRISHLFLGTNQDNSNDMVLKGRVATGDRHSSKTHPERVARGDRHSSRTHPERVARGDRNGQHTHPERTARGNRSGAYTHPEKIQKGEDHGMAILTWEQVREIRRRYKWLGIGGESSIALAKVFGVNGRTIRAIVNNKIWKE